MCATLERYADAASRPLKPLVGPDQLVDGTAGLQLPRESHWSTRLLAEQTGLSHSSIRENLESIRASSSSIGDVLALY